MYILNLAFMTERALEGELLPWLRDEILPLVGKEYRLLEVAEVDGDPEYSLQALNIAFQMDFSGLEEAREWVSSNMGVVRAKTYEKFGERVIPFATILAGRGGL